MIRVPVYAIGTYRNIGTILQPETVLGGAINRVRRDGDAPTVGEMYIVGLAADEVAGNSQKTADLQILAAQKPDIGAAWARLSLDSVTDDCPLSKRAAGRTHIYQYIRRACAIGIVVIFYVVAHDLEVAHLPAQQPDSRQRIVAYVAGANDCLVQIHTVEVNSDLSIVIDVTVVDQEVAIALHKMDAYLTPADKQIRESRLHRLFQPHTY